MYHLKTIKKGKKYTQEEVESTISEICTQTTFSLNGSFIYENVFTRIPLKCDVCNTEWSPSFDSLKRGTGCPKCGITSSSNTRRKTQEQVEKELINILGNKYTFKPFIYKNNMQIIEVYCEKHKHIQKTNIFNILRGSRCEFCAREELYGEITKRPEYNKYRSEFRKNFPINEKILRFNMMGYNLNKKQFMGLLNNIRFSKILFERKYTLLKSFWYKTARARIYLRCETDGNEWITDIDTIIKGTRCRKCTDYERSLSMRK